MIINHKSIALIFGYIPEIDHRNKNAQFLNLPQRFAFAMDTYSSDQDDMFFDQELWIGLLSVAFDYVGFDKIVVNESKPNQHNLYTTQNISSAPDDYELSELFENIKIFKEMAIIGYGETTCFTGVGGLHPYHDTYTMSFYVRNFDQFLLQEKFIEYCKSNDIYIRDICIGSPHPQISLLTRVINILS